MLKKYMHIFMYLIQHETKTWIYNFKQIRFLLKNTLTNQINMLCRFCYLKKN